MLTNLEESNKESSVNFDNRNLLVDPSISDILSSVNETTNKFENAGGAVAELFLGEETKKKKKIRKSVKANDPDYIRIKAMVDSYEKKQIKMQEIKDKIIKKKLAKEQQEQIHYQLLKFCKCIKDEDEEKKRKMNPENEQVDQSKIKEQQLMKLLNTSSEEQLKIRFAQRLWRLVRKKIKVIIMMNKMGGQKVHDMIMRKQKYREGKNIIN